MRKEFPCIVLRVAPVLFKNAIASTTFLSSVGRALLLHGRCRWFESSREDNWEYRQGLGGSVKPPLGGSIPSAPTIRTSSSGVEQATVNRWVGGSIPPWSA
jgi:hypothetical protein